MTSVTTTSSHRSHLCDPVNNDLKLRESYTKFLLLLNFLFLLGCQYGNPTRKMGNISLFFICFKFFLNFFFRVGKSLVCDSPAKWCLCA